MPDGIRTRAPRCRCAIGERNPGDAGERIRNQGIDAQLRAKPDAFFVRLCGSDDRDVDSIPEKFRTNILSAAGEYVLLGGGIHICAS